MEILSMKLDVIFKMLFTSDLEILQGFISDILDIPYDSIKNLTVENPDIPPDDVSGKFSRLDILLNVDERKINVELQIKREKYFADRSLYYWSKMYMSGLSKGEDYKELKKCIAVNIINFNMFDWEDYHSEFLVMEKQKGAVLSDKLSIHFFELKKLKKETNLNDRKELWMKFINAESEEELNMIEQAKSPIVNKAVLKLREMSADDIIKERVRVREKALHDETTALNSARSEGIAIGEKKGIAIGEKKGIAIGEKKAMDKMIVKLKNAGISDAMIKEILK